MHMSRRELLQFGGWGAASLAAASVLPKELNAAADEPIGLALCIALNYENIDFAAYEGWTLPTLPGCLPDAITMGAIAKSRQFMVKSLTNGKASRQSVTDAIMRAARGNDGKGGLVAGDTLLITYSGHGAQMTDGPDRDEGDRKDEAWCLFDGLLLDDELAKLWSEFSPGVRIVVVSDSCHSGTMLRNIAMKNAAEQILKSAEKHASRGVMKPDADAHVAKVAKIKKSLKAALDYHAEEKRAIGDKKKKYAHPAVSRALPEEIWKEISVKQGKKYAAMFKERGIKGEKDSEQATKAHVQLLSACKDAQLAADLGTNGQFTAVLDDVWGKTNGGKGLNYGTFLDAISDQVESEQIDQTPDRTFFGERNSAFEDEPPFTCKHS